MDTLFEKLLPMIDSADIISFDIFDTLIVRKVTRPEDIFRIIEKKTGIKGFAKTREHMQAQCSIEAEKSRGVPHCTFDELYIYMEKHAHLDLKKLKYPDLKNIEFETEAEMLTKNRAVFKVFEYAKKRGKRIIAASDMYFGKKELQMLLDRCGYDGIAEIYSSADVKKTKYRKDLFDHIAAAEKKPAHCILHIGDNIKDDCDNAIEKGFRAYCIPSEKSSEFLPLSVSIARGTAKTLSGDFWYKLGAGVGGLLYFGLITGLNDVIKKHKPDKIFFLSRDGYDLYELMKDSLGEKACYMYSSRRAMLLCGIDKLDEAAKKLLPPFTYGQSVKDILSYLDLDIPVENIQKAGFTGFDDTIEESADFDKFKNIFEFSRDILLDKAAKERESFKAYLQSIGFKDKNVLVFDCGWNGSSQYLLDRATALMGYKNKSRFVYSGIMLTRKSLRQLCGKKYDTLLFGMFKNRDLYLRLRRSIVLLELFFGAPENSLWQYKKDGLAFENTEKDTENKKQILCGIKDFVTSAMPIYEKLGIKPNAEECLFEVFRLIEHPTAEEAIEIGNIENADSFAAKKGQKKYIAKLSESDIKENPNEIYWPQGIYTRPDVSAAVKDFVFQKTGVKMTEEKVHRTKRPNVVSRVLGYAKSYGIATTAFLIKNKLKESGLRPYDKFIENTEKNILKTEELEYKPLFSFVIPVYNTEEKILRECIDSVLAQTYDNFELILADDASDMPEVRTVLSEYRKNNKITVIFREENGHISRCTNTAIAAAKGEYIVFADCDDTVAPNAVFELTKAVNADKSIDFIYSDEDKLDENGHRFFPHFKPDYSPDTLMSLMYTSHLSAYRRSIINELGGLRVGFEGSQDYDLTLRFTEKTNKVCHIPKILYHWRQGKGSTASDLGEKPYVMQAMERLKKEALERRGLKGTVVSVPKVSQYRVVYEAENTPSVSIIIPSKDNFDVFERCIKTLYEKTEYKNFETVVIDNGSNDENRQKYEALCKQFKAVYKHEPMPFNFAKMCNRGAEIANGEYLLFLNDDTEIISGGWLGTMVGQASLAHSGAVGAKLLYPNSTIIQHCGIINLPIGPCHALMPLDDSKLHYFCRNDLDYNYLAVTAACLCIARKKFEAVGGFDESFEVAYNDIDLGFKLHESGLYNSVRTDAVLYHHESISRGLDISDPKKQKRQNEELDRLYKKHPDLRGKDPFYNPNLSGNRTDFAIGAAGFNKIEGAGINTAKLLNEKVRAKIEMLDLSNAIEISGWAYIDEMPLNNLNKKSILLSDENGIAVAAETTTTTLRLDVSAAKGKNGSLNLSGFHCRIDSEALQPGKYRLGILLENTLMLKRCVKMFEAEIEIKG